MPAIVGGLLIALAAWFLLSLFQPFKGDGEGRVRVVVPKGAGVGEIADLLADRGVVSSGFFFEARATVSGRRGDLKPGSYTLRRDMSNGAALDALAAGPPPNIVTITVPEGRARREIAGIVGDQLEGDYLSATRRSPALDPREYGAEGATSLEGFLFPATFELKRGQPVSELVRQQLSAFRREFDQVDLRYAHSKNLTDYDVLIIASMVEREASVPRERPLIASVIYNRLSQGIPLGIDATLRFALNQWERPLTESELASPSPYNTRSTQGLPPGPIGNPGHRLDQGGGPPGADVLPLLRGQAGRRRGARVRPDRRRAPAQRGALQQRPRGPRRPLTRLMQAVAYGVLGWPVGHSRSPAMMRAAFRELGLDWQLPAAARPARRCSRKSSGRCPRPATPART